MGSWVPGEWPRARVRVWAVRLAAGPEMQGGHANDGYLDGRESQSRGGNTSGITRFVGEPAGRPARLMTTLVSIFSLEEISSSSVHRVMLRHVVVSSAGELLEGHVYLIGLVVGRGLGRRGWTERWAGTWNVLRLAGGGVIKGCF